MHRSYVRLHKSILLQYFLFNVIEKYSFISYAKHLPGKVNFNILWKEKCKIIDSVAEINSNTL